MGATIHKEPPVFYRRGYVSVKCLRILMFLVHNIPFKGVFVFVFRGNKGKIFKNPFYFVAKN
jgi:hypothetical protein